MPLSISNSKHSGRPASSLLIRWAAATFLFPALLSGQGVAREALTIFPADTQQLAYVHLAQLRVAPDYSQIRPRLFSRRLRDFQDFLRSMGTDPERDVEEVVLGWRGPPTDAAFFGLAEGRFQPEKIRDFFAASQLPSLQYEGFDLYVFGSGEDPADLFFAFLGSSSAVFGRLGDLKALLDVRRGARPALDSNPTYVGWEAELEGTAPQWGIASGEAAANQAAPWLGGGGKQAPELTAFLRPIQSVLYRIEWDRGVSTHISILCQTAESAAALSKVLTLWRSSQQAGAANSAPGMAAFIQDMEIQANASRVELSGSGSLESVDQVLRGPAVEARP